MDVGKYNTINLQKELAKSMEELMLNGRQPAGDPVSLQEYRDQMAGQENSYADQSYDIEAEDTGEMIPQEYDPAQYGNCWRSVIPTSAIHVPFIFCCV